MWVSICNVSKRQWFQKCVAPFPLKWGSFALSPLHRGVLGKKVLISEKTLVLGAIRDVQRPHGISWPLQENISAAYTLVLDLSAISLPV